MPDEEKKDEKLDPIDDYLKRAGRQETAAVTFTDLKALRAHDPGAHARADAEAEEKEAAAAKK